MAFEDLGRNRLADLLQSYSFWVFDATGPIGGTTLFSVFDPVLGFVSASAPELSIETQSIQAGNFEFPYFYVKSAKAASITLTRGVRWYDSDFYVWMLNAIRGRHPMRRNLVLVQFMGLKTSNGLGTEIGQLSLVERIPARAWYLHQCIPVRYKAGSDFDAKSADVSIAELEIQPETIDELTTATVSPVVARGFSLAVAVAEAPSNPNLF